MNTITHNVRRYSLKNTVNNSFSHISCYINEPFIAQLSLENAGLIGVKYKSFQKDELRFHTLVWWTKISHTGNLTSGEL